MSFTNPAPMGGYLTGSLIDESEINYWCGVLPDCIDGAGGGTYTLSAPLIISGDDVEIASLICTGITSQTLVLSGAFSVAGVATLTGDVNLGNSTSDVLSVNATSLFSGNVTLGANATLGSSSADTVTLNAIMGYAGSGRILGQFQDLPDSNTSVNITQIREVNSSATAGRTINLTGTPTNGDWFIFNNNSAFTQVLTGAISYSSFTSRASKWVYVGGSWVRVYTVAIL